MKILTQVSVILILLISINGLMGQDISGLNSIDSIPLDPQVRYGKLANGFTYYIRRNDHPINKIELHMVVKAGSLYEDKDQLQLAHLLEHMGFRGLEHFPEGIRPYLLREGIDPADVSASTGIVTTRYYLKIPGQKKELFDNSLLILRDWAHGFLLNPNEIDTERGIVTSEIRMSDIKEVRSIQEKNFRILRNPRYAPSVNDEMVRNLKQFKHESLYRFYGNWYCPDKEAAIIVGDINVDEVEEQVKRLFSDLKPPQNPAKGKDFLKDYAAQLDEKNEFIKITSDLSSGVVFDIFMKAPRQIKLGKKSTVDHYRTEVMDKLYNEMSRFRFETLTGTSSFESLYSSIDRGAIKREAQIDALEILIRINEPQLMKAAFQAAMMELERIKRYGFTEAELTRAREIIRRTYGKDIGSNSEALAQKYITHFGYGAAAPDPQYEFKLINDLINKISVEEVNQVVKKWMSNTGNRDIVVHASNEDLLLLNEDTVQGWISEIEKSKINPVAENEAGIKWLMAEDRQPRLKKRVKVSDKEIKDIGVKELKLANGVRIVMKPFMLEGNQNDKILLRGFSPGGSSLYTGNDYFSAGVAANIISSSGVGDLSQVALKRYLWDRDVQMSPYITDAEEGVSGSSAPADFETMLQLIYLYFVAPNKDEKAFSDWIARQKPYLISDSIRNSSSETSEKRNEKKLTYGLLKNMKLDRIYSIFQERFSNAGDFTFIITGNFSSHKLEPLVLKYLGALPSANGRKESPRESKVNNLSSGKMHKSVKNNSETSTSVQLRFSGDCSLDEMVDVKMDVLNTILGIELKDRLRGKEGATYSVVTSVNHSKLSGHYDFFVNFETASDGADKMIEVAFSEIEKIKSGGPDFDTFQKAIAQEKEKNEKNILTNRFWFNYLTQQYRSGEDPSAVLYRTNLICKVTAEDLRDAAIKYLRLEE